MIRRIVPVIAMAAMIGACSHNSSSYPEPVSPNMSRSGDAQATEGRPGRAGQRMEEMALRGITLSGDQQQRIDAIRASYRSQMEQVRQQSGGDRAAQRQAMQPLMERQQADVRAVLNADQQAQYDRNIAEMRERMQNGGWRRPNG